MNYLLFIFFGGIIINELSKTKFIKDKGDKWSQVYRDINLLSEESINFFKELNKEIEKYNKINNTNFQVFETKRSIERQERLIKMGRSWIKNAHLAPHVLGNAEDIAEFDKTKKIWIWKYKNLLKLRLHIESIPFFKDRLRKRIDKDLPHYEFLLRG